MMKKKTYRVGGWLAVGVLVSVAWVAAQEEAAPVGLRGIFPAEVPEGLTDSLAGLPENWQAWAEGVSGELEQLYAAELDQSGQEKVIESLHGKLKVINKSLADARYAGIHDTLAGFRNKLVRRLELAKAILATLQTDPVTARSARLQGTHGQLVQAIGEVEGFLKKTPNGDGWAKYLKVADLARAAKSDATEAVPVLQTAQTKLAGSGLDKRGQAFIGAPPFRHLAHATNEFLTVAAAPTEPVNVAELRTQLAALVTNLEAYEADASVTAAGAARAAFATLRKSSPDGAAAIGRVVQENYFNYNLRVLASESFLNRLMSENRQEQGGVVDYVLGANVSGSQSTSTTVSVDLLPSNQGARFAIAANGQVSSSTAGATSQATIYTSGYHSFFARKEVGFDGGRFQTFPATITVNASNTTTGASTEYGGLPIIGRIAERKAMSIAESNRGYSEAHARGRVSEQVIPKFDAEVDKQFAKSNSELKKVDDSLRSLGLFPDARTTRSTDTTLSIWSRLMATSELAANNLDASVAPTVGLTVQVHESLLNNSIDRMELAGKTMTEDEIKALLEERFSKMLNRPFKFPTHTGPAATEEPKEGEEEVAPDDRPKAMVFAEADPIRVLADNGKLSIVIRAGFKREGKEDIPTQIVTIPLNFKVTNEGVQITRGSVSVAALEKGGNVAEQVALAGVVRKTVESALPPRTIDRKLVFKRDNRNVNAYVMTIKFIDGWISTTLQ